MVLGTGVASALPVQGLAAVSAQRSKYIFAVAMAHAHADVSVDRLVDALGVSPATARGFLRKLVRNGVCDAPNAAGIVRLSEPLQRIVPQVIEYNPAGGYTVKGRFTELAEKARDMAETVLGENDDADGTSQNVSLSTADPAPPEASAAMHSTG